MWRRRKPRLVRQNDRSDCGAAALAMLALYHGRATSLERLRELTETDRSGASLLGLWQAAEELGFAAKAVRAEFEQLARLPLPAIAHVSDNEGLGHYVVIFRVTKRRVLVGDPAGTLGWQPRDAFEQRWSRHLLVAVPDVTAKGKASGAATSSWRRLGSLLRPHRGLLLEVIACALLMTMLAMLTSFFVQQLVDNVLVRLERPLLNGLALGMVLVVLFRVVFSLLRQYLLAHVGRKLDLLLIGEFVEHLVRLPMRFFETRQSGEILSRVTDAGKLREAVQGAATTAIVDGFVVVGVLAILWIYDLPLALATTCVVPLFVAAVAVHHPAAVARTNEAMEQGAKLAAHLIEDVAGIETLKVLNAAKRRATGGQNRVVEFVHALARLQHLDLQVTQVSLLISALAGIGVLWYGGHRVVDGQLSIGQLLFFYTMLATILEPLTRLATVNLKLQDALTALDRLYQVLEMDTEPANETGAEFQGVQRQIEFRQVTFGYGSRGPVLADLDLTIPAGTTVAIVGESGSGKSTLLRLLLQLHAPTAGQILIDGTDLRDFRLDSLRGRIGVVPQDPYIFNASVRENLQLGAPRSGMQEVVAATKAAQLEPFVNSLPQRYETLIGERGANLSGGQRQRLAIARALLAGPDVLIFDEATSHLDTATERAMQESLRSQLAGKTVIMVAHRLSTVKDADLIVVLERGRIVEQGTHAQLLAQAGLYASLWRAQGGQSAHADLGPLPPSWSPVRASPTGTAEVCLPAN